MAGDGKRPAHCPADLNRHPTARFCWVAHVSIESSLGWQLHAQTLLPQLRLWLGCQFLVLLLASWWHCGACRRATACECTQVFVLQFQILAFLRLQESIHSAASWFLAAQQHAAGLAAQMASHAASITEYSKQLHMVYLANDILLKG